MPPKETEYYELLQVSVTADENEIKRSYRKLALKYHPDKNPGDEQASEMFKKVSHAYETLSDPEKKAIYDRHGKAGLEGGAGGQEFDPNDIFSMFFGGRPRGPRAEPKPKDLVHELTVSLEDLYLGRSRKISVSRYRKCATCGGTGMKEGAKRDTCRYCNGRGARRGTQQIFPGFVQQVEVTCEACDGKGTNVKRSDLCQGCRGERVLREKKVLEVSIQRGAHHNDVFPFTGEGDELPDMRLAGDVLIFLSQQTHPRFHRVGPHLIVKHTLTLKEALCGFQFRLKHLDDRQLDIRLPAGKVVDPNFIYVLPREGMPNLEGPQGDLFVQFAVQWPEKLSSAQFDAIATLFEVPSKMPKVGGQVAKLEPYVKKKKGSSRARKAAKRRKNSEFLDNEESSDSDDEFEDMDEDDMEEEYYYHQQARGGGRDFGGGPQVVECGQQ